jgi:hypothetical protein
MGFLIFRYLLPVALMIGWVLYQLAIKRKKWASVQPDALTCLAFTAVWIAIAYIFTN